MKQGYIRRLSQTGQVTLPADLRAALGIQAFDDVAIGVDGDQIILKRAVPVCRFCGSSPATPMGPKNVPVCAGCVKAAAVTVKGVVERVG